MPGRPNLVTVPNVALLEVGEDWETCTGLFTFTAEDVVACIVALDDPQSALPY
jgi:hypothetical protein